MVKKHMKIFAFLVVLVHATGGLAGVGPAGKVRAEAREVSGPAHTISDYTRYDVDPHTYAKPNPLAADGPLLDGAATVRLNEGEAGIEWPVTVDKAASYYVTLRYKPLSADAESDLELRASVGAETRKITLKRAWADSEAIVADQNGNDVRPRGEQRETWITAVAGRFDFAEGENRLKLSAAEGAGLYIASITLHSAKSAGTYETYREQAAGLPDDSGQSELQFVEAERPALKSDTMLYPVADKTSYATRPSHPTQTRLNCIGGDNWKYEGQWLTYTFTVEHSGLYEIGMRFKQDAVRGLFTSRDIAIDDVVLFDELEAYRFPYANKWQVQALGDDAPFAFYLTEGEHKITFTVTQGAMEEPLQKVLEALTGLNDLYRSIIMVTSVDPDPLRDYKLDKEIVGLVENIREIADLLREQAAAIDSVTGQTGTETSLLYQIIRQLESFLEKPETIPLRITDFRDNISALGTWVLRIQDQPLMLDYLYVNPYGRDTGIGGESFFKNLWFGIQALVGSFTQDYTSIGSAGQVSETIRVWIGSGRDQAQSLKRIIDEDFTRKYGIGVELSLVQGTLVQATLAKEYPDVILNVGRGDPVNLAMRGGLTALDGFEGFNQVKARYGEDDLLPFTFEGHCYALPETKNFFMMFYRTDIFEELGIAPPQTWEEFYRIIPIIQRSNMQIGLPYTNMDANTVISSGIGAQNIFTALLYQNGGTYYTDDLTQTALDTPQAIQSFKQWTNLYTKYSFPLYYDFYNRFRTGEMPIGIQLYTMNNMLSMGAPEIDGLWEMALIPGVAGEDGWIDRSQGSTGTASILLARSEKKTAAWTFLEWWSSAAVQTAYGKELEVLMGPAGRYNPANMEAFDNLAWTGEQREVIKEQWGFVREVPEIPGGYYLSRNVDNAFKTVVLNGGNPREELYAWNKDTNVEIQRKRKEFHLD